MNNNKQKFKELYNLYEKFYSKFKEIVEIISLADEKLNEIVKIKKLNKQIKTNISFPFFINLKGQGYDDKKETILIYGLETNGYPSKHWIKEAKDINYTQYFEDKFSLEDCLKLNEICCDLFNFPTLDGSCKDAVKEHYKSPFWNFIRELRKKYPEKEYNIIWSNLVKFDINGKGIGESYIKVILDDKIIDEHKKLIKEEINIIKPQKVVILGRQKDKKTIYNKIIKGIIPDNEKINNNDDIVCKYSYIEDNKIIIYHIYHPNYLNKKKYSYGDIIDKLGK